MIRPDWQKNLSWWERFKCNWIPRSVGEWGCAISMLAGLLFVILIVVFVFSFLIRGIGWLWGV